MFSMHPLLSSETWLTSLLSFLAGLVCQAKRQRHGPYLKALFPDPYTYTTC